MMHSIEEVHVKTEEIHFSLGTDQENKYSKYIIYLDERVIKRSTSSIQSILSRIRSEYKAHNEDIHWIGISGIHYEVIIKRWRNNTIGRYILPIKKSINELNLRIMEYLYTENTDLTIFDELLKRVADSHSIVKKGKSVYKKKMYYYKLLVGTTDQSSLIKFKSLYDYNTNVFYSNYVELCDLLCDKLDYLGRSLGDEVDD